MILCFSGTGNSRFVATEVAKQLNEQVIELQGDILINPTSANHDFTTESRITWVFPIYSWGVPPIIVDFINNALLKINDNTPHYMVCTCGDDIGNAHTHWRRLISNRGWNAQCAYSVQMPNTYTLMKGFDVDSKELERHKLADAPSRISDIAHKIESGDNRDDVIRGSWAWVKTAIIYPYFKHFCMSPHPFHATEKCVGCGKCAKACPLNNITINNNRPLWHNRCALCLRCYHLCPTQAIAYGKATKGKGQYNTLIHNA